MKPFVKWLGGKTQLVPIIDTLIPTGETYIEPFIGGGAVFLSTLEQHKFNKYIINDINHSLIDTYSNLQTRPEELISDLKNLEKEYNNFSDKKSLYYKWRNTFNTTTDNLLKSSLMISLNKTCFNGLYRENKKGEFNSPFGYRDHLNIDAENLYEIADYLNKSNVQFISKDYTECLKLLDENSFAYIDPPYRPVKPNGFTTYNKSGFNDTNQRELAEICQHTKGKVLCSNSNDSFFEELYKGFKINHVSARRKVSCTSSGRELATELLMRNYD